MVKPITTLTLSALLACSSLQASSPEPTKTKISLKKNANELSIPFEKFRLGNGLTVILHEDHSDPIVALATIVHVGSNREKLGRTGFAHFFEHMAFNDSENVPQGANRKMIEELGGSRNGGTWSDGTVYYEVVPKDALEKLLWIDSDRLGFMINTVNEDALEREKQVVKNEKRERVDNQAYGHTQHVIRKNLYPKNHPYNWTVIGDLEDLQNASLEDVKEFYHQYYGPANATLVIAGDIEIEATKKLVNRWFGEIKASPEVKAPQPQGVKLKEIRKLYHLDAFAKVPEIRITFPTVEQYHPDSYALTALGEILSQGKRAHLYREVVEKQKLAPSVSADQNSSEIAGTFTIRVRANATTDLDTVASAIQSALANFEKNEIADNDLAIIKARQETEFYQGISSVLNKAFQLGTYEEYAGDPGFITEDIARIKAVSKKDIRRVYERYLKNKNYIMTSFVPSDRPDLMVEDSLKAEVVEEIVVPGVEKEFDASKIAQYEKTKTKHDRSEPPLGAAPRLTIPQIDKLEAKNGLQIFNIEHHELPLIDFSLVLKGGPWLESFAKLGTANLLADLLNEGTKNKTPEELEDAIGLLGATIQISSGPRDIRVQGSTLARNFAPTLSLVAEMLLQPRWDEAEFTRVKARQLNRIKQQQARPFSVASQAFYRRLYGDQHRSGLPSVGSASTVNEITLQDLKDFYRRNFSPRTATLHVVGDVDQQGIVAGARTLVSQWQGSEVKMPVFEDPEPLESPSVYFVDIPSAKQSVLMVGKPALEGVDPDFYKLTVAQNRLGAGSSSRLFQTLRIAKGYTYGAYSNINRAPYRAPFMAYSQVRANVTLESMVIIKDLISGYSESFDQEDLAITKNLLVKKNSRRFETLGGLLATLEVVSEFNLPLDYVDREQKELAALSLEETRALYRRYLDEGKMIYLVVGDAKTQLENVKKFGYGDPILLDREGKPL